MSVCLHQQEMKLQIYSKFQQQWVSQFKRVLTAPCVCSRVVEWSETDPFSIMIEESNDLKHDKRLAILCFECIYINSSN